jgi:hypothetical protein
MWGASSVEVAGGQSTFALVHPSGRVVEAVTPLSAEDGFARATADIPLLSRVRFTLAIEDLAPDSLSQLHNSSVPEKLATSIGSAIRASAPGGWVELREDSYRATVGALTCSYIARWRIGLGGGDAGTALFVRGTCVEIASELLTLRTETTTETVGHEERCLLWAIGCTRRPVTAPMTRQVPVFGPRAHSVAQQAGLLDALRRMNDVAHAELEGPREVESVTNAIAEAHAR